MFKQLNNKHFSRIDISNITLLTTGSKTEGIYQFSFSFKSIYSFEFCWSFSKVSTRALNVGRESGNTSQQLSMIPYLNQNNITFYLSCLSNALKEFATLLMIWREFRFAVFKTAFQYFYKASVPHHSGIRERASREYLK